MNEARRRVEEHLREGFVRIIFEIEKDEGGWPPVERERLWAAPVGRDLYRLENSPFWFCGASYGDIVSVEQREGRLFFRAVEEYSGHSTLHVVILDSSRTELVLTALRKLGCTYEGAAPANPSLLSVDVPPATDLTPVLEYLRSQERLEVLDYQEALLAHPDATSSDVT